MRTEDLIDAIGAIDPEYVREAEEWRRAPGIHRVRQRGVRERARKILLPLAACFCLIVAGSAYGLFQNGSLPFGEKGMSGGVESAGAEGGAGDAESIADGNAVNEDAADGGMNGGAEESDMSGAAERADAGAGAANAGDGADAGAAAPGDGADAEAAGAGKGADTAEGADTDGAADAGGTGRPDPSESGQQEREKIVINEVTELKSESYCMAAPASVQHVMPDALAEYYGVDVLPKELPDGYALTAVPGDGYAIGYDESGRVLDDHIRLSYESEGGDGSFWISVRTTESGTVESFADDNLPISVIGGNEVTIGHYMEGTGTGRRDGYLAIFEKQGVIVTVKSSGMGEETFLALLRSLQ